MFCHLAWLQISPARFKQVYSDKAGRRHDRNLQTSKSLKLTFAEKEPSTHYNTTKAVIRTQCVFPQIPDD
jgi:hypothetical protein